LWCRVVPKIRDIGGDTAVFSLDCLLWADLTDNARHRNLMLAVAKNGMNTAPAIERLAM
jgi:hypothetical protein